MNSKTFEQWVGEVGPVEAARLISEIEVDRGKKPVMYQSIQQWLVNGIPSVRVPAVSAVSQIPKSVLDPELFGDQVA